MEGRYSDSRADARRSCAARSGGIESTSANAQAQDIKSRFASFEAMAKSALDAVSAEDQLRKRFAQMRGQCRSCHDAYANYRAPASRHYEVAAAFR